MGKTLATLDIPTVCRREANMSDESEPSAPSRGSVEENADVRDSRTANTTDHAVPAATAPVDRLVRLGATDRESVGTDKAEPLTRDCGTGNTNARLEALEELSALDQELELKYGLTGNPMIKAEERTPDQQPTPGECSLRNGCASGRETVR